MRRAAVMGFMILVCTACADAAPVAAPPSSAAAPPSTSAPRTPSAAPRTTVTAPPSTTTAATAPCIVSANAERTTINSGEFRGDTSTSAVFPEGGKPGELTCSGGAKLGFRFAQDAFVLTAGTTTTRLRAGERTTIVGYDVVVVEYARAGVRVEITRVS